MLKSSRTRRTRQAYNNEDHGDERAERHSQLSVSAWVDKNGGDSKTLKWIELPNTATDEALRSAPRPAANLLEPLSTLRSADLERSVVQQGDRTACVLRRLRPGRVAGGRHTDPPPALPVRAAAKLQRPPTCPAGRGFGDDGRRLPKSRCRHAARRRLRDVGSTWTRVQPSSTAAARYKNIAPGLPGARSSSRSARPSTLIDLLRRNSSALRLPPGSTR